MRAILSSLVEAGRVREGPWGSDPSIGLNGAFQVLGPSMVRLRIIATDGVHPDAEGWEHVSVSCEVKRCPNWPEMVFVKNLFWDEDETVLQFHPPRNEYVNHHPTTLHMWRKRGVNHETPPSILVGPK